MDGSLQALDGVEHRSVAPGEWGLTVPCAGWPLDVGLRLAHGWLRLQAEVCGPGQVDRAWLLHRGRRATGVRFTETGAGGVWVQLDVPAAGVREPDDVDALLGLLVTAAEDARRLAAAT